MKPTWSLCHPTARLPDGWRPAYEAWKANCDNWADVEYILCIDKEDDSKLPIGALPCGVRGRFNYGRRCAVDAWNAAAAGSTGRFIVTFADDRFPCPHWDIVLLKAIPDLDGEYVLDVDTGGFDDILCFSMLTRKYYERYGRIF